MFEDTYKEEIEQAVAKEAATLDDPLQLAGLRRTIKSSLFDSLSDEARQMLEAEADEITRDNAAYFETVPDRVLYESVIFLPYGLHYLIFLIL